jgi:riboflavin synthase
MFTGIVEAMGEVTAVTDGDRVRTIRLSVAPAFLEGVKPGDSISVDGACLTPIRVDEGGFTVEAVGTTLGRTVAGSYRPGSRVNLERAMVLGGRLDGHLVQGHVDGLGELLAVTDAGDYRLVDVRVPEEVHRATLLHGSIALNGVSLTVNALEEPDRVQVAIIPHTWLHTNFSALSPGDPVNVEGDLIGKYVGRLLDRNSGHFPGFGGDERES